MNEREIKSINAVMSVMNQYFTATGLTNNYDAFCSHDVNATGITSNGTTYERAIEIKERLIDKNVVIEYTKDGWMIEKIKYNHLIQQKNPLYVNYIQTDRYNLILTWNLNKLTTLKESIIKCKKTTEYSNANIVNKDCFLLTIEDVAIAYIQHKDNFNDLEKEMPWHKMSKRQLKVLTSK